MDKFVLVFSKDYLENDICTHNYFNISHQKICLMTLKGIESDKANWNLF